MNRWLTTCAAAVALIALVGCRSGDVARPKPVGDRTSSSVSASAAIVSGGEAATGKTAKLSPDASGTLPAALTGAGEGPTAPAVRGATLATLEAPPTEIQALLALPDRFRGAEFDAVVEPYGYLDQAGKGDPKRVVAKVITWKPADEGAKQFVDFTGKNVLVIVDPRMLDGTSPAVGGRYKVHLRLIPARGVGQLYAEKFGAGS